MIVLTEDEYEDLVLDEARGRLEPGTDTKFLFDDLPRWRCRLVSLIAKADSQIRNIVTDRAEYWKCPPPGWAERRERISDFSQRRARVLHHRRKIDKRLREVNLLIAEKNTEAQDSIRGLFRDLAVWLIEDAGAPDRTAVPERLRPAFDIAVSLTADRTAA